MAELRSRQIDALARIHVQGVGGGGESSGTGPTNDGRLDSELHECPRDPQLYDEEWSTARVGDPNFGGIRRHRSRGHPASLNHWMNERHLQLCASAEWAETVRTEILPWAVNGRDLGDDVLEVGPGPGLTTDALRSRLAHLTAVEVDAALATALATRLAGTNVEVVHADAEI